MTPNPWESFQVRLRPLLLFALAAMLQSLVGLWRCYTRDAAPGAFVMYAFFLSGLMPYSISGRRSGSIRRGLRSSLWHECRSESLFERLFAHTGGSCLALRCFRLFRVPRKAAEVQLVHDFDQSGNRQLLIPSQAQLLERERAVEVGVMLHVQAQALFFIAAYWFISAVTAAALGWLIGRSNKVARANPPPLNADAGNKAARTG
jgi:hypothetical protein